MSADPIALGEAPRSGTPDALIHALGYAGLLPFAGLAALVWLVPAEPAAWVAMALTTYAALIASFLGGIHWGVAFARADARPAHLVWGVLPSLLAWPGVLMPAYAGLPLLGAVLLACYLVDRKLYPPANLSRWLTLRWRLSAVAALSCFVAAGAV